jgi:quercetin dioxygenase-like cupin family protein
LPDPVSLNPDSLDAVELAPDVYSVLLEDERVRVLAFDLPVGARDNYHYHPHEVGYFVTGGRIKVMAPGGLYSNADVPDSLVRAHKPWIHGQENIGDTDIYGIVVEIKDGVQREAQQVAEGQRAEDVAPAVYTLLSDNEQARVLEMKLPAGSTDGEHSHPPEVAYFLTGGQLRIHTPDGESIDADIPDGGVLSHEAWTHTVENVGETDVHAIVFEINPEDWTAKPDSALVDTLD